MNSDDKEAIRRCKEKWIEILNDLYPTYRQVKSCNKDISRYLVPLGTENEISYYGKPEMSYRFSNHWNWYSNLKKCRDETIIQCYSEDLPGPYERNSEGHASDPIFAISICKYENGKYHVIFGDKYDFKHNKWIWVE